MAVQLPGERAHLEQAEVLAVRCVGPQTRLAPGDGHGFLAVAAEDSADRDSRWSVSEQSFRPPVNRMAEHHDLPRRASKVTPRLPQGPACDGAVLFRSEKAVMLREEADGAPLLVERNELPLEAGLQADRVMPSCGSYYIRRMSRLRCRSGLCHEDERAQASE